MSTRRLGIIQSRGLGDLIIALPIAQHYREQGWDVYWPICEEFYPSMQGAAPWVHWIPVPTDAGGEFFYDEPLTRLKNFQCNDVICLYNFLSNQPTLKDQPFYQIAKFDEFKYRKAGVAFHKKWTLNQCITRNPEREQALRQRVVRQPDYLVYHRHGSDNYEAELDLSYLPAEWQQIEITEITDNIFDWLGVLEQAQALILVDSCFSNLVDQLDLPVEKYFVPRSHIQNTPVLGSEWTTLEPSPAVAKRISIFA